jgi:hypothetical protein
MKNFLLIVLSFVFLCSCTSSSANNASAVTNPTDLAPTATIASQPTMTSTPDYQIAYEKVRADPWTATDAEKAGYDMYVRQQLTEVGIENAETLSDYELLEAVITYQQKLIAKGGLANPEGYLVELPLSLHELIRTDMNNLVPVHREASRDNKKYGIGGTVQPSMERLQIAVNQYNRLNGFSFYGKEIIANTTDWSMNGDLVLLYITPGIDPGVGLGAVIRMYEGDKVAYAEVIIPTATSPISPGDLCLEHRIGVALATIPCPDGTQRYQGYINWNGINWKTIELADLINTLSQYKIPNVEFVPAGQSDVITPLWSDAIQIINNIRILEIN